MNQKKSTKILIILIVVILITILLGGFAFAYLATDIFRSEKDLFFKYITQIGDSENGFIDNQLKEYFEKRRNTPYNDEGNFSVNITAENGQEEFENINNFNITYSGQVDEANSKAEQNISINYSDEVNFPVTYKQIGNTLGLQTKYIGSKYIAVETDNLENTIGEDITVPEIGINNDEKANLTDEQKNNIKNTYMGVLNNNLGEEKFSKVKESELNGYKLTLTGEELKNILVQLLETLKNDQTTLDIINQHLGVKEASNKLETDDIDDLIESINDEEFDEQNIEITVYSKNGKTSKMKIYTTNGSFNIEKIKEDNKLKLLFYYEPIEEIKGKFNISATFEGLGSMQNIKELYESEIQFEQQPSILERASNARSANQVMYEEEKIGLIVNESITESMINGGSSSSAITKESLDSVIENDNLYANIEIGNTSDGNIQIQFTDTGDIFVINNQGKIITKPEKSDNEENNGIASSKLIQYNYQFENNITFTDTVNIEELTSNNSMILTDYESEQVSNFLSAVGERLVQVNKQQMEELGLEEDENPIQYLIPSLAMLSMSGDFIGQTTLTEEEINTFNSKFENYEGTNQQAQTVKGLLSTISRNNRDEENDDIKITELNFNGQEYEATEENITSIKNNMNIEKNYRIEFEKDSDTGLIFRAVINEK